MSRLCHVVFSYYPADPRPRREAEALVEAGYEVDLVCLLGPEEAGREEVGGVEVHRLPVSRRRGGKLRYAWEYLAFITLAFFKVTALHLRKGYRLIHVHNMPDVLVASALFARLSGAKLILDLHDPMPEVFDAKYDDGRDHGVVRFLRLCERLSIGLAHQVLTPNIAFRDLFVSRGCPARKIEIVMNSPQTSIFGPPDGEARTAGKSARFVLMYHGTIVERSGLISALEAVALARARIPSLVLEVYGDGDFVEPFLERRRELGLEDIVRYHGHVSLEAIVRAVGEVDLGLIPNERTSFTELNFPTRIFEYLHMNKPVIVPRTRGILDYFDENSIFFFDPGDAGSLADVIESVYGDRQRRETILKKGRAIYLNHTWDKEAAKLVETVDRLTGRRPLPATEHS